MSVTLCCYRQEGTLSKVWANGVWLQALIQCAGCARREAIAALRRHNNNPSKALKSELARLRVDRALLAELIGEYATQRGLQQPPSGDSMQQDVQQVGDDWGGMGCAGTIRYIMP
jgi:hypothetical protein